MSIISISGKAGHGKDTVAKMIMVFIWKNSVEYSKGKDIHYNPDEFLDNYHFLEIYSGWVIKRFADKLKDIVCILIGCSRKQIEDRNFKEKELGEEGEIPLQEEWKAITGYEGLYEVSNFGRIKSLNRLD